MNNTNWKKAFFISLMFNFVVILSFLFFSFVIPASSEKRTPSRPETETLATKEDSLRHHQQVIYKAKVDSLWQAVRTNREYLWEELQNTPPDSHRIEQIMDEIIRDEVAVKELTYRFFIDQLNFLSEEQKQQKLENLVERSRSQSKKSN